MPSGERRWKPATGSIEAPKDAGEGSDQSGGPCRHRASCEAVSLSSGKGAYPLAPT